MMKLKIGIITVLTAVFLVSCFWGPDAADEGALSLTIDGSAYKGSAELVRVYLMADDATQENLIDIDSSSDAMYQQVAITSGQEQVLITNLGTAFPYRVLVAFGNEKDGAFVTESYAETDEVWVSGGEDTVVEVTQLDTPFSYMEFFVGKDVRGVVVDDTYIYASTVDKFYRIDIDTEVREVWDTPKDVNSLSYIKNVGGSGDLVSVAGGRVLLNTVEGIYPFNPSGEGSFDADFSSQMDSDPDTPGKQPVDVIGSGYFHSDGTHTVYYQISGGLGGMSEDEPAGASSGWDWVHVDLSDQLVGKPINDTEDTGSSGFFASVFGAFRLDGEFFADPDEDIMAYAEFIAPESGGENVIVSSFGYDGVDKFYVCTFDGVWLNDAYEDGDPIEGIEGSRIEGTKGFRFLRVQAGSEGGGSYAAFLSRYFLFLYNAVTGNLVRLPFVAGTPGLPKDVAKMSFRFIDGEPWLGIAGPEGLVAVDVLEAFDLYD